MPIRIQNRPKPAPFFLTGLLFLATALSHAQSLPDAGALQQQIERDRKTLLPKSIPSEAPALPQVAKEKSGAVISVTSFQFTGNTLLSKERLESAVAPYLNKAMDLQELQKATAAVADAYRDAGWIVRAYLPTQEIVDGIVVIRVIEAVFGNIRRDGQDATRIPESQVIRLIETQQKPGTPLSIKALDRGLLLADDLPGVSVNGALKAGANERETDLILKLSNDAAVIGEVAADNYGSRSTGINRLTANLNINSALGKGDLLIADAILTEGSEYLRLAATMPIGSDGWRTGINASFLSYKLITSEFAALNAKGWSNTYGAEATYPIIRSRLRNLYFSANIDQRSYENEFLDITSSRYSAKTLTLGLNGNAFDKLAGGGATSAALALVSGSLNLDGSPNQAADANTTRTAGDFQKIRYSVSRQQTLSDRLVGFAGLSGQWAGKNLDSSEKFYLGGASGVRAYPTGEGGGTLGNLLNLELRWRLKQDYTLTGFYDYGRISINSDNNFNGAPDLNSYSLKGAGLSLAWQSGNTSLKAAWSHRIGDNPNPTNTGTDQDGSLIKNRYWLLGVFRF